MEKAVCTMFAQLKKTTQIVLIINLLGANYIFLLINGSRVRVPDGVQERKTLKIKHLALKNRDFPLLFLYFNPTYIGRK
jgi:hypothetical protein